MKKETIKLTTNISSEPVIEHIENVPVCDRFRNIIGYAKITNNKLDMELSIDNAVKLLKDQFGFAISSSTLDNEDDNVWLLPKKK